MDKNAIIAKCTQEPEDRLLLARVWDKYEQTERKNIPKIGRASCRERV